MTSRARALAVPTDLSCCSPAPTPFPFVVQATRLGIMVWGLQAEGKTKRLLLAWAVRNLVDETGRLVAGPCDARLWTVFPKSKAGHGKPKDMTDDPDFMFRAPPVENRALRGEHARIHLYFEDFVLPVVAPVYDEHKDPSPNAVGIEIPVKALSANDKKAYEAVILADTLEKLNPEQKKLVRHHSHHHHGIDRTHARHTQSTLNRRPDVPSRLLCCAVLCVALCCVLRRCGRCVTV
jgi:hypothetical protein